MIVLMGQGQSRTESGTGVVKGMIEKEIKGDSMEKAGDSLVKDFGIDWEKGLTSEEVRKRIGEYGYNEVPEKRVSPIMGVVKKFWGITPWMLEITIALEWALGKYFEMYVVMGLLVFNAILGFIQEERANSALELLKEKLRINARVKRNGSWTVIPARELVPGDVIRLRAGDFIPADVKMAEGNAEVDQSSSDRRIANGGEESQRDSLQRVHS